MVLRFEQVLRELAAFPPLRIFHSELYHVLPECGRPSAARNRRTCHWAMTVCLTDMRNEIVSSWTAMLAISSAQGKIFPGRMKSAGRLNRAHRRRDPHADILCHESMGGHSHEKKFLGWLLILRWTRAQVTVDLRVESLGRIS